jgi:hypothetical protein
MAAWGADGRLGVAWMTDEAEVREKAEKVYRVYNDCTKALANEKYNSARLGGHRRLNTGIDIALAIVAPGAASSWAIWQSGPGSYVWTVLAAVGGLLAIVKPFLQLPQKVDRYSKARTGYSDLYYDFLRLATTISSEKDITEAQWSDTYVAASDRFRELAVDDDPVAKQKLLDRCVEEAKQEIESEGFWLPPRT